MGRRLQPHGRTKALEMATPAERFRLAPITLDAASVPVDAKTIVNDFPPGSGYTDR
jgi:hypothetical protein